MKKLFSFVMALALSLTVFPQATINVSAQEKEVPVVSGYEIYPTPQVMTYDKGSFIIDKEVNIVVEKNIDSFTKDRLEETLALKDIKATYSDAIDSSKTNILLGIFESKGTVDTYFSEKYTYTHEDLFNHIDSSFLKVDNNVITIVGKDTDSVFYAITSLYHVFNQMDTNTIENFTIEDYADVLSRGFIEGYYGNPWTTEDRVDLMEFGGYYKLNSYFYAPKDDPKHNSAWRVLYTEEELVDMKKIAEAGNKSKTRFVYALHPYMNNAVRHHDETLYQEDLQIIKNKLGQMLDVGVRQFSILGDDAGVPGNKPENYTRLMVDLTDWLKEMQKEYEGLKTVIPFVPNDYMGDGSSSQLQTIKDMPENIKIVMTGGKVWGEVSTEFTDKFTKNMDRGPYMWINWPCTDNSKEHLIMGGGHVFLEPNVDPDSIEGIVLNPMQQSEPSKLAIFINAAYSWNIWDSIETADKAWEDAFSYIDHNTAEDTPGSLAYRELSKHMINQNMDSRVKVLQESIDLKPILDDFKNKFNANEVTKEDIATVRAEFEILANAAKVYRSSTGNKRTLEQITPWINSWDDTTEAALRLLDAVEAILDGNDIELLSSFSAGQTAFAKSKSYGFNYVGATVYAEVGVQHIVPFIKLLETNLQKDVEEASGLGKSETTFISNFPINPEEGGGQNSSFKHMFDGDPDTAAYWPGTVITVGAYFGLDFGTLGKEIEDFTFLLGIKGYLHDTVYKGYVEYTENGKTWTRIDSLDFDAQTNEISYEFEEPVHMRSIRVVSESNTEKWFGIRELSYNKNDPKPDTPKEDFEYKFIQRAEQNWKIVGGDIKNMFDGQEDTFAYFNARVSDPNKDKALKGDWIGIDLGRDVELDKINVTMGYNDGDKLSQYAIDISKDNKEWTEVGVYDSKGNGKSINIVPMSGEFARYVRIRVTEDTHKWIKITNFTVSEIRHDSTDNVHTNVENPEIYSNFDEGYVELTQGTATLQPNDYYGVDLGKIEKVTNISQDFKGEGLTLEYSLNGLIWTEVTETTNIDFKARYVRYTNKTTEAIEFNNKHFKVEFYVLSGPSYHSGTIADADAMRNSNIIKNIFDNNLSTAGTFKVQQRKGQTAIFDLGQTRDIKEFAYYVVETQRDFIRGAEFEIADTPDSDNWKHLLTIENIEDAGVMTNEKVAKEYEPSLVHSSVNPGYMLAENKGLNVSGRYIKMTLTRDFNRWTQFADLRINDGEFVSQEYYAAVETDSIEKPGQVPSNMFDGKIGTSYSPQDEAGSFTYTLSNPKDVERLRVLQSGITPGVTLSASFYDATDFSITNEEIGSIDQAITEFNVPTGKILKSITVTWTKGAPSISQIVTFDNKSAVDKTKLNAAIEETVDTSTWTTSSQQAYVDALENAKAIQDNDFVSQVMVDSALSTLEGSINKAQIAYSGTELQTLVKEEISNKDRFYTAISFNKYVDKMNAVKAMLENIADTPVEAAEKLISETKVSIDGLVYSTYQRELAVSRYNSELRKAYTADMFTSESYKAYVEAREAIDKAITESSEDIDIHEPSVFKELLDALDSVKLVNVQTLKALQTEFKEVNKDLYLEESFKVYEAAVNASFELLVDGTQDEVDKAVNDIRKAYESLEIDASGELVVIIEEIDGIDGSNYSKATYDALINRKDEILADKDATDEQKIAYYKELVALRSELVAVNALNNRIEAADAIVKDDNIYTKSSYDAFIKAHKEAKDAVINATTDAEVDAAIANLNTAIENLTEGISKADFEALIAKIDAVNVELYTKSTVKVFNEQTKAIKAANYEEVSALEFAEFADTVDAAIAQLEIRVTDKAYKDFIDAIEEVNASEYTADTYAEYSKALAALKAIDVEDTSLETFNALVKAFNAAKDALEEVDNSLPLIPLEPSKPGIDKPGTDKPGTDKPGTDKPSDNTDKLPTTGLPTNYTAIFAGLGAILLGLYFALKIKREESN